MSLEQPIFIVGVGRSGSTIFHQAFCRHPHVAWLSKTCDLYPNASQLNTLLMHLHGTAVIKNFFERFVMDPKVIKPSEAYHFWEHYCPGFSRPCRDLNATDVTHQKRKKLQQAFGHLTTENRHRLLAKITGWPRIDFLQEIWPDAKFINVVRDPRAVVNSMLAVDWWDGWKGPQGWRWGELTPEQKDLWDHYNRSFVALAAIELDILKDAMDIAKAKVKPNNLMEVRYEEFCEHPMDTFRSVTDFCDLNWMQDFEASIQNMTFRNTNYKWQKDLTSDQQDIVNYILKSHLYDVPQKPQEIKTDNLHCHVNHFRNLTAAA